MGRRSTRLNRRPWLVLPLSILSANESLSNVIFISCLSSNHLSDAVIFAVCRCQIFYEFGSVIAFLLVGEGRNFVNGITQTL